jgi:ATP-dependent DNA helicase RecG
MFAGKVGMFGSRATPRWQLSHPEFELFEEGEASAEDFAAAPVPIYPAGKDLTPWAIRRAIGVVLDTLGPLDDPLPAALRDRRGLEGLAEALVSIHRPKDFGDMRRARERLKFDEAFVLQAVLLQRRQAATAWPARPRPRRADGLLADFDGRLPFSLTEGQALVGEEIAADLALEHPMHRLLQGEVGAGKTVVALRAMLQVVDAGGQAVLLAPTEVLAQQHHRSISGRKCRPGRGRPGRHVRRHGRHPAHRLHGRRRAQVRAARRRLRHRGHRGGHARPAPGACPVRRPGAGRGRRAAPVRRGAA